MQHVIKPSVLVDAFDSSDVARFGHHADGGAVSTHVGAQEARFCLADVLTNGAEAKFQLRVLDAFGKAIRLLIRNTEEVECKPLRGLGSNARKPL
jgi:hypothetical protein